MMRRMGASGCRRVAPCIRLFAFALVVHSVSYEKISVLDDIRFIKGLSKTLTGILPGPTKKRELGKRSLPQYFSIQNVPYFKCTQEHIRDSG